jgi:hypothetical protein
MFAASFAHARVIQCVQVSVSRDPVDAAITIMHHAGMGTMQPNSVLLPWPEEWELDDDCAGSGGGGSGGGGRRGEDFVDTLHGAVNANKAVMVSWPLCLW